MKNNQFILVQKYIIQKDSIHKGQHLKWELRQSRGWKMRSRVTARPDPEPCHALCALASNFSCLDEASPWRFLAIRCSTAGRSPKDTRMFTLPFTTASGFHHFLTGLQLYPLLPGWLESIAGSHKTCMFMTSGIPSLQSRSENCLATSHF